MLFRKYFSFFDHSTFFHVQPSRLSHMLFYSLNMSLSMCFFCSLSPDSSLVWVTIVCYQGCLNGCFQGFTSEDIISHYVQYTDMVRDLLNTVWSWKGMWFPTVTTALNLSIRLSLLCPDLNIVHFDTTLHTFMWTKPKTLPGKKLYMLRATSLWHTNGWDKCWSEWVKQSLRGLMTDAGGRRNMQGEQYSRWCLT